MADIHDRYIALRVAVIDLLNHLNVGEDERLPGDITQRVAKVWEVLRDREPAHVEDSRLLPALEQIAALANEAIHRDSGPQGPELPE